MRIVHFEHGGVPGIAADDKQAGMALPNVKAVFQALCPKLIAQGPRICAPQAKPFLTMQAST